MSATFVEDAPRDALAVRATVGQLVAAFRDAEASVRTAFAMIADADEKLNLAFGGRDSGREISVMPSRHSSQFNVDECIDGMTRCAWQTIVDRLELRRMMSIARWAELEQQLDKGTLPAITEENVHAFAAQYRGQLQEMLKEAVREVYDWLRPLQRAIDSSDGRGETDLFKFAAHKKGTLHLTIKRADLLLRFNAIAGARLLAPGAAA